MVNKGNPLAKEDIALVMTTVFGRKQRYCFSDKQTSSFLLIITFFNYLPVTPYSRLHPLSHGIRFLVAAKFQ